MTEDDLKKHPPQRRPFASRYAIRDRRRALSTFIVIFLVLAGITALIVWLVYRPHEPKFKVVSLAIYDLNFTSPPFMSTSMQFTVVTRNPNKRVSFFYDQLSAFVSYKNQVRYKGGAIRTRHHGIHVKCDVFAGFKKGFTGQVPLLGSSECQVDWLEDIMFTGEVAKHD
ncbi:NDR1/HIN1-like protein 12 [Forsythia ovata]|uniref:NDR1/HIN1-like protein 12 n=1 Tax=Forsythia ovata TaxID=205694 RepID=A0ABD1PY60_9LAMI